ncbi:MAG: hypothetical protein JXR71_12100 [Bacteroidales bacterium]|nr:hypothetical protein [Bacteroidales bacterium]
MITGKSFAAKILMFGEYSLMVGSQALSIPYFDRSGRFIQSTGEPVHLASQKYLSQFLHFLKKHTDKFSLNLENLENDLNNGLAFETNIPIGYGLGSSGSLVAAVYERYALEKTDDLIRLKGIFSELESFFHGKSSGLDPLVSYIQKPLWIKGPEEITTVEQIKSSGTNTFFLIDSQQIGETQPLVNYFTHQCKEASYLNRIEKEIVPVNRECISSWLSNKTKTFFPAIHELSQLSLELFKPMIPKGLEELWKQGLKEDIFSLKLCGSGGGGMILGFTRDFKATEKIIHNHPIYLIQNF